MPPILALALWLILTFLLFRFDPGRDLRASSVLWIPVIWLFIVASRSPSQWFGGNVTISAASMEQGSPLDRNISLLLMLLAVAVLLSRSFPWGKWVASNRFLLAFLAFALVSSLWSDFPLITLKRWFRDVGSYLIILVPLSERDPAQAVGTVLRRLAFLLVPLSIVLDRYFVALSRQYDPWTGVGSYVGATTSKNMLGLLCLVSGIYLFWDILGHLPSRARSATRKVLLVDAAMLGLTLWLLHTSQSTTSELCLVMGCMVLAALKSKKLRSNQRLIRAMVPTLFLIYLVLDFGFGMTGQMASAVGKDPTLTDRTKIWAILIGMHTNPILGTGYQSFWLGPRLLWFWQNSGLGHLNEAHNGYLELYLELGMIGVGLISCFLLTRYRAVCKALDQRSELAVLGLAVWLAIAFYNMSEAAFEGGLMYSVFLMSTMTVPATAARRIHAVQPARQAKLRRPVALGPLRPAGPAANLVRKK